jgi:hypothetical protein
LRRKMAAAEQPSDSPVPITAGAWLLGRKQHQTNDLT